MRNKELKELEAKARLATPGPWEWQQNDGYKFGTDPRCTAPRYLAQDSEHQPHVIMADEYYLDVDKKNLDYLPLANPTAILSLIERLRECEEALDVYFDREDANKYFEMWGRE